MPVCGSLVSSAASPKRLAKVLVIRSVSGLSLTVTGVDLKPTFTWGSLSSGRPFKRPTFSAMRLIPSSSFWRTALSFDRTVSCSSALSEMMLCLKP